MLFIVRLTQQYDVKLSYVQLINMNHAMYVRRTLYDSYCISLKMIPRGLKHVDLLIVHNLILHHIVV